MSVFLLTSADTQTAFISLIFPVLSILTPWCSVLSCKVLQLSIGRRGRIIHNMCMRTGVCQSQGQVPQQWKCVQRERVCVTVCLRERYLIPHLLYLYLCPYPHLGSISLESAHNIKCSNTFTNTSAHTHLSKAVVDHEP